jgi:hypothetical protein
MGKTVNKFVAESFTNVLGQTINPGDRVAYVTHSHSVYMHKAWFAGVFKNERGEIVRTRVRGVRNTKYVPTGKIITYEYKTHDYDNNTRKWVPVTKTSSYPETVEVECEPTGTTALQCHRIIKIED